MAKLTSILKFEDGSEVKTDGWLMLLKGEIFNTEEFTDLDFTEDQEGNYEIRDITQPNSRTAQYHLTPKYANVIPFSKK